MTKQDKAELRALMRAGDARSHKEIANDLDCSVGTVRKYRRAFALKQEGSDNG